MSMTKNEQFFWAAVDGDLPDVKALGLDPTVDVNWKYADGLTALYNACILGHLSVVEHLLRCPKINVNVVNLEGATPFGAACGTGQQEVVSLMLADPRVNPARARHDGITPVCMAAQGGHASVVSALLADPRVDPNMRRSDHATPLWMASQNGHLPVVQLLLSSARKINTRVRLVDPRIEAHNWTAAEWARLLPNKAKPSYLTNEIYARARQNGAAIADLIDEYERDPVEVRQRLRSLPWMRATYIGRVFALVVFFADDFLRLKRTRVGRAAARFFAISTRLPLDLQMVLCNRMFGSERDVIASRDSEPAFKWVVARS